MKFSAVIFKPKIIKRNYKSSNNALIISFISIISGIICSSIIFQFNFKIISDKLMNFFVSFTTDFTNKSFFEILGGILITNFPYCIIILILGTCSLGSVAVIILNFFSSYGIGSLTMYIISSYGLKGFEYFLLVMFPGKVLQIFAMIILCETAISGSNQIKKLVNNETGERLEKNLYISRFAFGFGLIILASLVDCITIKLFSSLFSLN